jgi:DNA-binding CsgD family transcriptional regulator
MYGTALVPSPRASAPAIPEGLQFVHRVSRVLCGRPDAQQLLRALVLAFPARFHAVTAILAHCCDDGTLAVTASFGYPDSQVWPNPFPLGDDWPISRALREPDPFCVPTSAQVLDEFPIMGTRYAAPRPLAATQLTSMAAPVGVVALGFAEDVQDVDGVLALLGAVRDVVGLYAGLQWETGAPRQRDGSARAGRRSTDPVLSPRQTTVLELLAEGYGNGQIAHRIGFSESTVRHETMALYRWFGVGGRREAVAAARARGLLPEG